MPYCESLDDSGTRPLCIGIQIYRVISCASRNSMRIDALDTCLECDESDNVHVTK